MCCNCDRGYLGERGDPDRPYWVLDQEDKERAQKAAFLKANPNWKPPHVRTPDAYGLLKAYRDILKDENSPEWLLEEIAWTEAYHGDDWNFYSGFHFPQKPRPFDEIGVRIKLTTMSPKNGGWSDEEIINSAKRYREYLETVDVKGEFKHLGDTPWRNYGQD